MTMATTNVTINSETALDILGKLNFQYTDAPNMHANVLGPQDVIHNADTGQAHVLPGSCATLEGQVAFLQELTGRKMELIRERPGAATGDAAGGAYLFLYPDASQGQIMSAYYLGTDVFDMLDNEPKVLSTKTAIYPENPKYGIKTAADFIRALNPPTKLEDMSKGEGVLMSDANRICVEARRGASNTESMVCGMAYYLGIQKMEAHLTARSEARAVAVEKFDAIANIFKPVDPATIDPAVPQLTRPTYEMITELVDAKAKLTEAHRVLEVSMDEFLAVYGDYLTAVPAANY
jgi:hypothetical protein